MTCLRVDWMASCVAIALCAACSGSSRNDGRAGDGGGIDGTGGSDGSGGSDWAGNGSRDAAAFDADAGAGDDVCTEVTLGKLDLLFVVDDSGSMIEEQESLRREFPRLLEVLTTGQRPGKEDMPPITDMHLGVISTNMGMMDIEGVPGCQGLGDDGILQNTPSVDVTACDALYPRFLTYEADVDDPTKLANDFACIASLGTEGCGFEQPLEATLKAIWPSVDATYTFINPAGETGGQGDRENAGFVRDHREEEQSVFAIVVVTDEEDCSAQNYTHFTPAQYLPAGSELLDQPINTRCFHNKQNLYAVERYINGFKGVRPRNPEAVLFAAIAGVPPDAVDATARERVDFSDAQQREDYYAAVLAHPQMEERLDMPAEIARQAVLPSCITDSGKAYPPRRIVDVARGFGEQGIIQSICEPDFGPAMDVIIDGIGRSLNNLCFLE